jgi:predicted peptidase
MKSNFYATGRTIVFFSLLFLFSIPTYAQQTLEKIDGWNAYVHLPDDYNDGTGKVYPLICFVPGTGEVGTDASLLLVNGPSKFVANGNTMQFTVNGKLEKPIVISLQPVSVWPNAYTLNVKLDSIIKRYRCDLQRINVTGLSMGAWSWDNFVDNYSSTYTNRITSIVSMSAPPPDNSVTNMKYYAINGGTAWFFEGNQDLRGNDQIRDTMNKYVAGSARYTLYVGGHCCWNTFYDPSWTENGESVYTWMLKQKKDLIKGALPPQANAGNDSTLAAPLLNLALKGYGNDPNGLPIILTGQR